MHDKRYTIGKVSTEMGTRLSPKVRKKNTKPENARFWSSQLDQ